MADLSGLDLNKANLFAANLNGGANLCRTSLNETNLSGADLATASLSNATLWSSDIRTANLSAADLNGADFTSANLAIASLRGANLRRAILRRCSLSFADLRASDLTNADLEDAELSRANLRRARLTAAMLKAADLTRADLGSVEFGKAEMGFTMLCDVDLSTTRGLETVRHRGPSTIGVDTLYRSGGMIPEVFLRGIGCPDEFIRFVGLDAKAMAYPSCFISYSTQDEQFARRLHTDLQKKGVRCWFAPHDVRGGRKLHEQIDQAILTHERVLLILSTHSMKSEWVKTEIAKARKREIEQKQQILFPVRLVPFETIRSWECFDADAGKDSAREIREYFIPDFSNWKNQDDCQEAFQRLIKDLKAIRAGH